MLPSSLPKPKGAISAEPGTGSSHAEYSFMVMAQRHFRLSPCLPRLRAEWLVYLKYLLITGIIINLLTVLVELTMTHPTQEAKIVVGMITRLPLPQYVLGAPSSLATFVPLLLSCLYPVLYHQCLLAATDHSDRHLPMEKIWVEAPQRVQLV